MNIMAEIDPEMDKILQNQLEKIITIFVSTLSNIVCTLVSLCREVTSRRIKKKHVKNHTCYIIN